MQPVDASAALRALAALHDPSRSALYDVVRAADGPVTRAMAADAIGISRKLAAFHLDKLVDANLLSAAYEPGARTRQFGRPPKVYRPAPQELRISIPERHPETLAQLLIEAVTSAHAGETPTHAALRVAYESGQRVGADARQQARPGRLGAERAMTLVASWLAAHGFEPTRETTTCVRLRNCPYLPLSAQSTQLVCGINHQHLAGVLRGLEAPPSVEAELAPRPGHCCVQIRAS